jgi:hypothetical protein
VDADDLAAVDTPRAIFCTATMMTPVLLATPWTVTGSAEERGGARPGGRGWTRPDAAPLL